MRFFAFAAVLLVGSLVRADDAGLAVQSPTQPAFAGAFHFKIPDGWTDLSPGAPETNFGGLSADIAADARAGKFAALAIDRRAKGPGQGNMSAVVENEPQDVNEQFVDWYPIGIPDSMKKENPEIQIEFKEHKLVKIGDVDCARFVYDIAAKQSRLRVLVYIMPGGAQSHAQLTYSTNADAFDKLLPTFEASANATTGMAATSTLRNRTGHWLVWVGGAFALLLLFVSVRRSRKA